MMHTIGEAIKEMHSLYKEKGVTAQDLRFLVMNNEGYQEPIDVLFAKDKEMKKYDLFVEQAKRLANNEPVEYIVGTASFLRHQLKVNGDVLIPRGETEELVSLISEKVSEFYNPKNYLVVGDIGTGSGCIPIGIHDNFPNWLLVASDISSKAMDVAKENFEKEGIHVQTLIGDALEPYIENKINLDIIVSNPPYILSKEDAQESVRDYEPASALWMEKGKSVYESIFRDYKKVKKGALTMFFEISPDLEPWLIEIMGEYLEDYDYSFHKDLNGDTRFLIVDLK